MEEIKQWSRPETIGKVLNFISKAANEACYIRPLKLNVVMRLAKCYKVPISYANIWPSRTAVDVKSAAEVRSVDTKSFVTVERRIRIVLCIDY